MIAVNIETFKIITVKSFTDFMETELTRNYNNKTDNLTNKPTGPPWKASFLNLFGILL